MTEDRPQPELFVGAEADRADDLVPDVEITASVSAAEIRWLERPRTSHDDADVDDTGRTNLPRQVEPGEVYTDVHMHRRVGSAVRSSRGR